MAKYFITLLMLLSLNLELVASENKLKSGDILLQPLSCWSCSLIEQQEDSQYSHIGIYINMKGQDFVLEALGSVRLIPLEEFLGRTKQGAKVLVRRHINYSDSLSSKLPKIIKTFIGRPYDKNFLWNNFYDGDEAFYCSELVFKIFEELNLIKKTKLKRMPFDVNPLLWDRYFKGETPRGEIGSSPEDFNKSLDFESITRI